MPPDLYPEGPGIPGTTLERVECPIHGDTWAFDPHDNSGCCIAEPYECGRDGVLVTYVLRSEYDQTFVALSGQIIKGKPV